MKPVYASLLFLFLGNIVVGQCTKNILINPIFIFIDQKYKLAIDKNLLLYLHRAEDYQPQKIEIYNSSGSLIYTNTRAKNNKYIFRLFLDRLTPNGINFIRVEFTCKLIILKKRSYGKSNFRI